MWYAPLVQKRAAGYIRKQIPRQNQEKEVGLGPGSRDPANFSAGYRSDANAPCNEHSEILQVFKRARAEFCVGVQPLTRPLA